MRGTNKADIIQFQKYMKPSGSCQACLSQTQLSKDCIITCEVCRSCIHQTHYGSQLTQPPQIWQCERCRYFLQNGPSDIACEFCPSLRGIMKQFTFQNRKIWLHPECTVWGYPIIYFASNKREGIKKQKPKTESTYFWVRDYQNNQNPCQICKSIMGYRIKCKYYSCTKSYHITCARLEGIVRDLQSMKIQSHGGYFPVYCKQHIQLKIEDFKKRVKLMKQKGEIEKAAHFQKVANLHVVQLKNLQAAVEKCKLEQQMIKKMSIETRRNVHGYKNVSFNELQDSFSSQQSKQFLKILQQQLIDQQMPLQPLQTIKSKLIQQQKQSIPASSKTILEQKVKQPGRSRSVKNKPEAPAIVKQIPEVVHPTPPIEVWIPPSLTANASQIENEGERRSQMVDQRQQQDDRQPRNGYQQMFQDW